MTAPEFEVDPNRPAGSVLDRASEVIRAGGIVLSPTDTVYGLACDPGNPQALRRLLAIKQRSPDRGLLLLLPSADWVPRVARELPGDWQRWARRLWPGPVTCLFRAGNHLDEVVSGASGRVGCRLPAGVFLQQWLDRWKAPLVSTSANLSGQPVETSIDGLRALFGAQVDLLLYSPGLIPGPASTVIDLSVNPPVVLRQGCGWETVRDQLGRSILDSLPSPERGS